MKAVLVEKETKKLYIDEFADPLLEEEELLVNIKATAMNRADLSQKQGTYPLPKGSTPILGLEMAGVVESVGKKVKGWQPGDRVCSILPGGGYAEKVAIPAGMAMRIPDHFSFEQAAAIPEVFLTAYLNMFTLGGIKQGDAVLIHAGASGVGTAAIQLAREAGATSIITAGTEKKRSFCLELGASLAIDYNAGPFAPKVKEATGGKGVNQVLDFIGAPYFEQNIESLAVDGRLLLVGVMGGRKVKEMDLMSLKVPRVQVIGTMLRVQPVANKIKLTEDFVKFAMPLFEKGRLKPIIDSVWDIEQVNEAHAYMENNKNIGKIILKTNSLSK